MSNTYEDLLKTVERVLRSSTAYEDKDGGAYVGGQLLAELNDRLSRCREKIAARSVDWEVASEADWDAMVRGEVVIDGCWNASPEDLAGMERKAEAARERVRG